jgi:hypothetical protein
MIVAKMRLKRRGGPDHNVPAGSSGGVPDSRDEMSEQDFQRQ